MTLFPGCKCCDGGCITKVWAYSQRMTALFTVENFNSGEIFKHVQITGIDFTGATASIAPILNTANRYDTLKIELASGGVVLLYSIKPAWGAEVCGWGLQYCLNGFLNDSTNTCTWGSAGTVPQYAWARVEVDISTRATSGANNRYKTEWQSDEAEYLGAPSLMDGATWTNLAQCIDGSDTAIDLNYQLHDPVTVTFTEYMRPRFCGDCQAACYDTRTEKKCIQNEDIPWGWTTDGFFYPTLAECSAACGGFKCYTYRNYYLCVGPGETPPVGWTTDGVEHATLPDCEAACGGGGGPCCDPDESALLNYFRDVANRSLWKSAFRIVTPATDTDVDSPTKIQTLPTTEIDWDSASYFVPDNPPGSRPPVILSASDGEKFIRLQIVGCYDPPTGTKGSTYYFSFWHQDPDLAIAPTKLYHVDSDGNETAFPLVSGAFGTFIGFFENNAPSPFFTGTYFADFAGGVTLSIELRDAYQLAVVMSGCPDSATNPLP